MTNYFRSGDEIHYDCEIFEQMKMAEMEETCDDE